jgi:hypothetical protein
VGPIHYTFTKNFIPSQPETRAFQDLELPEEEKAGKGIASIRRARNLYIKPSRRPLHSLQVECLILISRALHLYRGGNLLTYNFQDAEDKDTYWTFTIPSSVPRPIGFSLRQYTWLELTRYIKPDYKTGSNGVDFIYTTSIKGGENQKYKQRPFI